MYAPVIKSAKTRKRYAIGSYEAAFLQEIVSEGGIGYEYIIVVFERDAADPFLFVTSERNDPAAGVELFEELGLEPDGAPIAEGESHFLCLFDEEGHKNFGESNDWGDAEKFERAALKILKDRLGAAAVVV